MSLDAPHRLALVAAFAALFPTAASARDCADPLQTAAEAVSGLPGDIPYQIPDQLQELYNEASELTESDPDACLVIVGRMNALIARYRSGGPAPEIEEVDLPDQRDAEVVLSDLRLDDQERLRRRIERASDDDGRHLQAVGDYRDAARVYAATMRAFSVSQHSRPSELSEIDTAVAEIDALTRAFEEIVVLNAPNDVMHTRLEDAVRSVEEARRALERAWQRYHARKAAEADDFIAPLTSPGFQPAPLVGDFIAPLGDAETRAAQVRLRAAERALKQVRNSWDPYIHRIDWPFLDMRDGYKQAFQTEYKGFEAEMAAFDATLDAYAPDRIAEFTRRRVELTARHERRLDAIFERYAIR
ncbi:MAG TPA: hypothetical protein VN047_09180 [Sphingopyxis sp.]|uniref:hypothetical protein n=1 Tax=Sphingopyxis sp. TaxID=1908224 RepID=UPI002B83F344|nr:hypothetical protein [Sphingopyxis sp.]HWW57052.1 hypothetical protein [Sphingopyxis sp.]